MLGIDVKQAQVCEAPGGTPSYGLDRYVQLQRVWFFSRFGHN